MENGTIVKPGQNFYVRGFDEESSTTDTVSFISQKEDYVDCDSEYQKFKFKYKGPNKEEEEVILKVSITK